MKTPLIYIESSLPEGQTLDEARAARECPRRHFTVIFDFARYARARRARQGGQPAARRETSGPVSLPATSPGRTAVSVSPPVVDAGGHTFPEDAA